MSCVTGQTFPEYPLFATLGERRTGKQQGRRQATWHSSLLAQQPPAHPRHDPEDRRAGASSWQRGQPGKVQRTGIYFTSPKTHRVIGRPLCSSRPCPADAIQTEAKGLVTKTETAQSSSSGRDLRSQNFWVQVTWHSLCSPPSPAPQQ